MFRGMGLIHELQTSELYTSETEMSRLGAIGRQATVESHLDPKAAERFQSKCKP